MPQENVFDALDRIVTSRTPQEEVVQEQTPVANQEEVQEQVTEPTNQEVVVENTGQVQDELEVDDTFYESAESAAPTTTETTTQEQSSNDYEALQERVRQLEAELNSVFADPYEKARNDLKKSGANAEKLKAFEFINNLGDLSKLSDEEAIVQRMIFEEERKESVARHLVQKNYSGAYQKQMDEDDDDYVPFDEVQKELDLDNLRVDANKARQFLQGQLKEMIPSPESQNLLQAQARQNYQAQLNPVVEQFKSDFAAFKQEVKVTDKDGNVTAQYAYSYPKGFQEIAPIMARDYLADNNIPITPETVAEAREYVDAMFWKTCGPNMLKNAMSKSYAQGQKAAQMAYENPNFERGGTPVAGQVNTIAKSQKEAEAKAAWFRGIATGNLGS